MFWSSANNIGMYTRRCEVRERFINRKRKARQSDEKCTKLSMSVMHIAFDNFIKAFSLESALYAALPDNNEKRLKLLKF